MRHALAVVRSVVSIVQVDDSHLAASAVGIVPVQFYMYSTVKEVMFQRK